MNSVAPPSTLAAVSVLFCTLWGCVGTSTGNPVRDGDGFEGSSWANCDVTPIDVGPGDDRLGFSADDILDFAAGEHALSLAWLPSDLDYGPESGEGTITLSLRAGDEPVRYLDSEPKPSDADGLEGGGIFVAADIGTECPDALEIPVVLGIRSGGGALDEEVEAVLIAVRAPVASLRVELPLAALAGSFSLELAEPPADTERSVHLWLAAEMSVYGDTGTLNVSIEESTAEAVSQSALSPIARFPADGTCTDGGVEVDADFDLGGYRAKDLATALDTATEGLSIRWPDAPESGLSLALTEQHACLDLQGNLELEWSARAVMRSDDGRLDTTLDVMLVPDAETDGPPQQLELFTPESHVGRPVADIEAAVAEVDLAGYDGALLDLRGTFMRQDDGSFVASGTLEVSGTTEADCGSAGGTDAGGSDAGGGSSSPGCAGRDERSLLSATWGP